MHIAEVACFDVVSPSFADDTYVMSGGRVVDHLRSAVVRVTAEDGTVGYGEACTLGGNYLDGFPDSVLAATRELVDIVMGCNPLDANALVAQMDRHLKGHLAAKSAIDVAMWDLRGKLLGQPVARLLGGIRQTTFPAFVAVGMRSPEKMALEARDLAAFGFRHWQLKLGDDPVLDAERTRSTVEALDKFAPAFFTCDANTGWAPADALRFLRALEDFDVYLEQPCSSLRELAEVRAHSQLPMLIDESVRDVPDLVAAIGAGCAQALNLKPTRVGGLTKAARIRDFAEAMHVKLLIDEPMGGELATCAMAHLAASAEPDLLIATSYMSFDGMPLTYSSPEMMPGARFADGQVTLGDGPGLGVTIDEEMLGDPLWLVRG